MLRLLQFRRWLSKGLSYFRDPHVALWKKGVAAFAILYLFSPIDAIPDFIPVIGWLDDLGVLAIASTWLMRQIEHHSQAVDQGLPRPLEVHSEEGQPRPSTSSGRTGPFRSR